MLTSAVMRASLARARAEASSGLGGVQLAPATAPITSALEATNPKMKAFSTKPTSSTRVGRLLRRRIDDYLTFF